MESALRTLRGGGLSARDAVLAFQAFGGLRLAGATLEGHADDVIDRQKKAKAEEQAAGPVD